MRIYRQVARWSSPRLISTKSFVRELADGQDVDCCFVVRSRSRGARSATARPSSSSASATRAASSRRCCGTAARTSWPSPSPARWCARPAATRSHERWGPTLTLRSLRAAGEDEYDLADLMEAPPVPYEQMPADLDALIETVQRPHLRELLRPAARPGHEDRPHLAQRAGREVLPPGLSPRAARALPLGRPGRGRAGAPTFPGIDRDVAVTGALLHDIGKVQAYASVNGAIELTDAGKLLGEIPLGYYLVRRAIERRRGLPRRRRPGAAAHHPQPPRQARARQPRRALHARGDAGPLHRQPRRQPRQLRPHREDARRGRDAGRTSTAASPPRPTSRRPPRTRARPRSLGSIAANSGAEPGLASRRAALAVSRLSSVARWPRTPRSSSGSCR